MHLVNVHVAKTNFFKLIEAVTKGEEIVIAGAGKPIARLCPFKTEKPKRKPGQFKGKIVIADDFDAPLNCDI